MHDKVLGLDLDACSWKGSGEGGGDGSLLSIQGFGRHAYRRRQRPERGGRRWK
jgi:hypothetical protein